MLEAAEWGFVAASSLLLGALIGLVRPPRDRVLGLTLAFGAGVLISAVSFDLIQEAVDLPSSDVVVAVGFILGALTFFAGDTVIQRTVAPTAGGGSGNGPAIVLGAVLDGIPESLVIGISLIGGTQVSVAVVVAVFLSNVPESIGASADLAKHGVARSHVLLMWIVVVAASTVASALGYELLGDASPSWIAGINAFAAGAILTMLSDSMIPQGFSEGGQTAGLATALGFGIAAALSLGT